MNSNKVGQEVKQLNERIKITEQRMVAAGAQLAIYMQQLQTEFGVASLELGQQLLAKKQGMSQKLLIQYQTKVDKFKTEYGDKLDELSRSPD